jgi:hypothetical protein
MTMPAPYARPEIEQKSKPLLTPLFAMLLVAVTALGVRAGAMLLEGAIKLPF